MFVRKIAWVNVAQLPATYEANKQPGMKMFSVPPVLVSQLRSWIKRHKGGRKGKKKRNAAASKRILNASANDAEDGDDDPEPAEVAASTCASFCTLKENLLAVRPALPDRSRD